jgi:hypothetical protein
MGGPRLSSQYMAARAVRAPSITSSTHSASPGSGALVRQGSHEQCARSVCVCVTHGACGRHTVHACDTQCVRSVCVRVCVCVFVRAHPPVSTGSTPRRPCRPCRTWVRSPRPCRCRQTSCRRRRGSRSCRAPSCAGGGGVCGACEARCASHCGSLCMATAGVLACACARCVVRVLVLCKRAHVARDVRGSILHHVWGCMGTHG